MPKTYMIPLNIANKFIRDLKEVLNDFDTNEQIYITDIFLKMVTLNKDAGKDIDISRQLIELYDKELVYKYKDRFKKADSYNFAFVFCKESMMQYALADEGIFIIDGQDYKDKFELPRRPRCPRRASSCRTRGWRRWSPPFP